MKYIFFSCVVLIFFSVTLSTPLISKPLNNYKIFEADGKVGMVDDQGNVLIPAEYDHIGWSKGVLEPINNVIGYRIAGAWGLISLKNEKLTSPKYSQLYHSNAGLLVAARKGKVSQHNFLGLISTQGKEVLPFRYTSIQVNGLRAIVSTKNGKNYNYGVVDLGNKVIVPIQFKDIKSLGSLRFAVKNDEDKIAIYSDQGTKINDYALDSIAGFNQGYAVIFDGHRQGLINTAGKVVAEPIYRSVRSADGNIEVRRFNDWVTVSMDNQTDQSWVYTELMPYSNNRYVAKSNQKTWILDASGNVISPNNIDFISQPVDKKSTFRKQKKWGVLRENGTVLLEARFDSIVVDGDIMYGMTHKNGQEKWSLYDTFAIKKSNKEYDIIGRKTSNFYPVRRNNFWGFLDRTGEEVIHCVYDEVRSFVADKVVVKFHGQYGILDKYGEWIVFPQPQELELINEDLYLKKSSDMIALKNVDGETIYFTENKLEIRQGYLLEHLSDGKFWKINFDGRIVREKIRSKTSKPKKYEEIRVLSEGLYGVKIDGFYGFIDNQNRLLISNRYEDVGLFQEGLAAIKLRNKWGFINKSEDIVVQPNYDSKSTFINHVAIVSLRGKHGIIDTKGNELVKTEYDHIERLDNGRFIIAKNNLYGLLDKDGRLIINVKYETLNDMNNGQVIVEKFDQFGVVDLHGVDVIPIIYDKLTFDPRFEEYLAMKKSKWEKAGVR